MTPSGGVRLIRATRACFVRIESEHAPDSLVWSHFLRRTGAQFGGKCSSMPTPRRAAGASLAPRLVSASVRRENRPDGGDHESMLSPTESLGLSGATLEGRVLR